MYQKSVNPNSQIYDKGVKNMNKTFTKGRTKRVQLFFVLLLVVLVMVCIMTVSASWQKDRCLEDLDNQEAVEVI